MDMSLSHFELVGRGSSKDLYSTREAPGHIIFRFSDRVSVFDYGALPEAIPGKGLALERSARAIDRMLSSAGLKTAFDPQVSARFEAFAVKAVGHPKFEVNGARESTLHFIPLEIIFRWGVVPGSSYHKRHTGLRQYTRFQEPIIEFSTKLEASDRMVDSSEAQVLAGSVPIEALERYARKLATVLLESFKACGLTLWDGKIECAWDSARSEIVMVDAITADELCLNDNNSEVRAYCQELWGRQK
jgi:phosphoribosylaminoimidazole-succinocarboxamide synthase